MLQRFEDLPERRAPETPQPTRPQPSSPAAILALQRSAGNQAVARALARTRASEPVARATGGPDAAAGAADPGWVESAGAETLQFLENLWQDDPLSAVRLALEGGRLVPVAGLFTGLAADVIGFGQDICTVPHGVDFATGKVHVGELAFAGLVDVTIAMRSVTNAAGNAIGHLISFPQFAAWLGITATAGETASGVGAPAAPLTAGATVGAGAVNVVTGFDKAMLTFITGFVDLMVPLEAAAGQLMFPDKQQQWADLAAGYVANLLGDVVGLVNDIAGVWSAGLTMSGPVSQVLKAVLFLVKQIGWVMGKLKDLVLGAWNVLGGKAVAGTPLMRSAATDPATIGGAPGPEWFAARGVDFETMRGHVDQGDGVLGPLEAGIGELLAKVTAEAAESAGSPEAAAQLRENLTTVLADVEQRLELVSQVEPQAAPLLALLDGGAGQLGAVIDAIDAAKPPSVDLGEGAVADTVESVVGAGVDAAIDAAKQAALAPLREMHAMLTGLPTVIELVVQSAQILAPVLADAAGQLHDALAQTETLPEMVQALIDANVAFASAGEVQSFGELRGSWQALGPDIDGVTEAMRERAG